MCKIPIFEAIDARFIATLLGGLISGVFGILAAMYQFNRRGRRRREQWVNELNRIFDLYLDVWPDSLDPTEAVGGETVRIETDTEQRELMYIRARDLSPQLQSHIINSPPNVETELINKSVKVASKSQDIVYSWDNYEDAGASSTSNIVSDYKEIVEILD